MPTVSTTIMCAAGSDGDEAHYLMISAPSHWLLGSLATRLVPGASQRIVDAAKHLWASTFTHMHAPPRPSHEQ